MLNFNDLKNEGNCMIIKKFGKIIIGLGNKRYGQLDYSYVEFQIYIGYLEGDYKEKEDLNNNNKTFDNIRVWGGRKDFY